MVVSNTSAGIIDLSPAIERVFWDTESRPRLDSRPGAIDLSLERQGGRADHKLEAVWIGAVVDGEDHARSAGVVVNLESLHIAENGDAGYGITPCDTARKQDMTS